MNKLYKFNIEERRELDKFYTNEDIIYSLVKEYASQDKYKKYLFIEPSAGNGALLNVMDKLGLKYKGFDLAPEREDITKQDFLEFNLKDYTKRKNIITFMNPPYGFSSNLVVKFFNKASEFSKEIWMIAPKTVKKNSVKNRLNPYFKMISCVDLPKNSFLLNGQSYDVPSCFSIWVKTTEKQTYNTKITSDLFEFTTQDKSDIAVRRVGGRAGQVLDGLDYSKTTTYFIKITEDYDKVVAAFKSIDRSIIDDTVGVRSISKPELISLVEEEYSKLA